MNAPIALLFSIQLALAVPAVANGGQDEPGKDRDGFEETIEVKRAQQEESKHPSLRFLKDHRVFLRSQLDRLRLQVTRSRSDSAEILDERWLLLEQMAAAIAAATDTIRAEHMRTADRQFFDSVTDLGDLEVRLGLIGVLLAEQRERLLMLEEDFLAHQETALVILIKGLAGQHAPSAIILTQEDTNEIVRVELTPAQRSSLEQGGIAQVYHEFVEPRRLVFLVGFEDDAWPELDPVAINVEPARDRLTFLEIDFTHLDRDREALGLSTAVWYR